MPVGATICVSVSVTHAVRRQLTFTVHVCDDANAALTVASGTHARVYIQSDAFDSALQAKAGETGVRVGLTGTSTHFVDLQHIASRELFGGPRSVDALATSSLMNWAEEAAIAAVEEHLPEGSTTVGGETSLAHVAPTPKGMQVTCRAVLARISTSRSGALQLMFEVTGEDRGGAIMTGTHLRFMVNRNAFEQRARGVLMPDGRRRGSCAGPVMTPLPVAPPTLPSPPRPPPQAESAGEQAAQAARPPRPPPVQPSSPPRAQSRAQPPPAQPPAVKSLPKLMAGTDLGLI